MNPLDFCTAPWTGWDNDNEQRESEGSPFLDGIWDDIKSSMHDPMKEAMSQYVVDQAVREGLIDSHTGRQILPVVEIVFDKVLP